MTANTKITVVLPAGNFESDEDAYAKARAYRRIAAAQYPDAEIDVEVIERQTGGGLTRVLVYSDIFDDYEEDEDSAEYLDSLAENEWDFTDDSSVGQIA